MVSDVIPIQPRLVPFPGKSERRGESLRIRFEPKSVKGRTALRRRASMPGFH